MPDVLGEIVPDVGVILMSWGRLFQTWGPSSIKRLGVVSPLSRWKSDSYEGEAAEDHNEKIC